MGGNTTGKLFTLTTWGESHGEAVGAVVDGCPPGIPIDRARIQGELDRRRPGKGGGMSSRNEEDRLEILSGIFDGQTTGAPITLIVRNRDRKSSDYDSLKDIFRPGHGDYSYQEKFGIRDHRGGGRASGRETVARVAGGAIAKELLLRDGISCRACTIELGGIVIRSFDEDAIAETNLCCPDREMAEKMEEAIEAARRKGDTLGGIVEVTVRGCPAGLGDPVFDKMDADLAKALMSIGTVKAVEIGVGMEAARMTGFSCNDAMGKDGFLSNNAGGILAGITTGSDIILRVACKPIPSIAIPQGTLDREGKPVTVTVDGRHDVSVIPRIIPVCEAMVALVLADHLMRQKALG